MGRKDSPTIAFGLVVGVCQASVWVRIVHVWHKIRLQTHQSDFLLLTDECPPLGVDNTLGYEWWQAEPPAFLYIC